MTAADHAALRTRSRAGLVFLHAVLAAALVLRIHDEERLLVAELPGYDAYRREVRYRLVPHAERRRPSRRVPVGRDTTAAGAAARDDLPRGRSSRARGRGI